MAERYDCCEDLIADLKQARTFLLPDVVGDQLGLQKKLAILDTEPQEYCSPAAVMHDLLFRDPLDVHLQPGEDTIRVLAVGAGTYGQKFIDICLQAGQILDKKLHITAVSQDPELDREVYFQVRPALPDFLDRGDGDGYARLDFCGLRFCQENTAAALDELLDSFRDTPLHYVFVSLGDDGRSREAAAMLAKETKTRGMHCSVNFAVQSMERLRESEGNPVYIHAPINGKTIDPQLKKMAWNTHVAWADGMTEDKKALRRQFRKKYHLEASLAYALSVGSKLRSVGIFEKDPEKAAAEFSAKILEMPGEQFKQLVALEHRRWVLDKVTSGWQLPRSKDGTVDLESGIARGSMKDNHRKTHPCIVKSTADTPLRTYTKEQWNRPNDSDVGLDALDTLSIQRHRLCLAAAQKLRESRPLQRGDLPLIRQRIDGSPEEVRRAYEAYALCLTQILGGSPWAARALNRYETAFVETLILLPAHRRRELTARVKQLHADFFPAAESCLYRDYKQLDERLIRQIPFILTGAWSEYREQEQRNIQEPLPADAENRTYEPKPLDTSDICMPPELMELTEQIAANIHDVWAQGRILEGWRFGESRDDAEKITPCLVPYEELPESEKQYDRNTALQTLKFIVKLGWKIQSPDGEAK